MTVTLLKPRKRYIASKAPWPSASYVEQRGSKFFAIEVGKADYWLKHYCPEEVDELVAKGAWLMYWSEPLPLWKPES